MPAVAVPQAAAHDQQGRVRHAVPGDHQLQLAGRGVQRGVDARQRDVGDEEVHDRQERAGEQEEHPYRVEPTDKATARGVVGPACRKGRVRAISSPTDYE